MDQQLMCVGTATALIRSRWRVDTNTYEYEVLLAKRKVEQIWELPGGKVGSRELVEDAAAREFYEETGITIKGYDMFNLGYKETYSRDNSFPLWLTAFFGVFKQVDENDIRIAEEHDSIRFFPVLHLPDRVWPNAENGIIRAVKHLLDNALLSGGSYSV